MLQNVFTRKKESAVKQNSVSARYALLDELRGLDLVSMMLYHGCWDLVNLFGIQADWYYGLPGHLWQQSICWVFILLSGFCVQLGHHTLRQRPAQQHQQRHGPVSYTHLRAHET